MSNGATGFQGQKEGQKLVNFFATHDPTQLLKVRIILDSVNIPYRFRSGITTIFPGMAPIIPYQLLVPEQLYQRSMDLLEEAFEIDLKRIPEFCPACHSRSNGRVECPSCGLFLA